MSQTSAGHPLDLSDPYLTPPCPKQAACSLLEDAITEEAKDWGQLRLTDCEASLDVDGRLRLSTTFTLPSCGSQFADQVAEDLPTELLLLFTAVRRRIQSGN